MSHIYVGLDIGGSLAKVCIASSELIAEPVLEVEIDGQQLKLFARSFADAGQCLTWIKETLGSKKIFIKLGVTGGGATKYKEQIGNLLPKAQPISINQFQSNVQGLQFIRRSNLPVSLTQVVKTEENQIVKATKTVTLSECQLPLQFISLGSGVNYNKIGLGVNGLQRQKVEDPKTSFDGYLLQGTSLGGAYIFGLIKLLSKESQGSKIVELIKENDQYKHIYDELIINLLQSAISLSFIHNTPSILPSGSILSLGNIQDHFEQAVKLCLQPLPFKRSLLTFQPLQGYLGAVGVLYSQLKK